MTTPHVLDDPLYADVDWEGKDEAVAKRSVSKVALPNPTAELPHNDEAEQAVLGAILISNDALVLKPEHFFVPLHARVFEACQAMVRAGKRATPITLKTQFLSEDPIGGISGPQYLGRLAANVTTIIAAKDMGALVFDLAAKRKIIELGNEMVAVARASTPDETADAILETLETDLAALAERGRANDYQVPAAEAARQALEYAATAYQRDGELAGLSTGLLDLDRQLGGLGNGNLVIIAGRPGMGKSALACGIAKHNAERHRDTQGAEGCPVGIFSLEMTASELFGRYLAQSSRVPFQRLRIGDFHSDDYDGMMQESQSLSTLPLYIDQSSRLTIGQLASRARRWKRQRNIGLLVVDYLQLLDGNNRKASRYEAVTDISRSLKALAKELAIPVVALAQLSRETERDADKRPQLSHLRESGSIEQDADIVMLLYREEAYVQKRKPDESKAIDFLAWKDEMRRVEGLAKVFIDKARHGPEGVVALAFNAPLTAFGNLASSSRYGEGA